MREINEICPVCGFKTAAVYMVTAECWAEAGFTYYQNAHLVCLVGELHRPITREDFTNVPVNFNIVAMFEEADMQPPLGLGGPVLREAEWCANNA